MAILSSCLVYIHGDVCRIMDRKMVEHVSILYMVNVCYQNLT